MVHEIVPFYLILSNKANISKSKVISGYVIVYYIYYLKFLDRLLCIVVILRFITSIRL